MKTAGVLAVVGMGLVCAAGSVVGCRKPVWAWPHWNSWVVLAFASAAVLYPLRMPSAWDELAYHLPHARQWALSGRLEVNDWLRYPWFPFNYNLLHAAAMVVYDDVTAHMLHACAGWLTAFLLFRWALPLIGRVAACCAAMLWMPDYAGAIDYLQAHPVRKVYQSGMEGVLYYLPFPVWGDHFGPWRYRDFLGLAPERLAARFRQQGFEMIVVRRPYFPSAEMPAFGHYFRTVYEDPMFRIFTLAADPPQDRPGTTAR